MTNTYFTHEVVNECPTTSGWIEHTGFSTDLLYFLSQQLIQLSVNQDINLADIHQPASLYDQAKMCT